MSIELIGKTSTGKQFQEIIKDHTKITELDFRDRDLVEIDLSPLKLLKNLKILRLSKNKLNFVDLSPITVCLELKILNLESNNLNQINLYSLSSCKNLLKLTLHKNELRGINLSPLESCRNLQKLTLHSNKIETINLQPLRKCENLSILNLQNNCLSKLDLSPLYFCKKLIHFSLDSKVEIKWNYDKYSKDDLPFGLKKYSSQIEGLLGIVHLSEADNEEISYYVPEDIKENQKQRKKVQSLDFLEYFKWFELMHFARVAKQLNLLDDWGRSFMYNVSRRKMWKAHGYDTDVTDKQKKQFSQVFKNFINNIPYNYVCNDSECKHCNKLIALHTQIINTEGLISNTNTYYVDHKIEETKISRGWVVDIPLFKWQTYCIETWMEQKAGIIKVVTGAGKTLVALEAISRLTDRGNNTNIRTIIVVPTIALLHQWMNELVVKLNVDYDDIGLFYGKEWGEYQNDLIQIYVINSAREYLASYVDKLHDQEIKTFLIMDECHRYASEENSKIFDSEKYHTWTLGLSATPRREADNGYENTLVPNIGEIIFEYNYEEALNDGIIPLFSLINCQIFLSSEELEEYEEKSEKISRLKQVVENRYPQLKRARDNYIKKLNIIYKNETGEENKKLITALKTAFGARKNIVHDARNRYNALIFVLNKVNQEIKNPRIMIFHERIDFANKIHNILQENGFKSEIYHSGIHGDQRSRSLENYRKGKSNILVTCRALDEGLDVPNTNVGIIAASTQSLRQRIQRIGRILRKAEGKDHSYIYTIYVPKLEERIFKKNEIQNLLGIASIESLDLTDIEGEDINLSPEKWIDVLEYEEDDEVYNELDNLCPSCSSVQPLDAINCSICGFKLEEKEEAKKDTQNLQKEFDTFREKITIITEYDYIRCKKCGETSITPKGKKLKGCGYCLEPFEEQKFSFF
ncbi:MAG: DEAD/DEAH box helicase family protein [Candidatus Heimdallarchaeaceae archaeon]